jgi:hypothetical protein
MENNIIVSETIFGLRAYEDGLLIGSSSWLMAGKNKIGTKLGWDIYSRTTPDLNKYKELKGWYPSLTTWYFATRPEWTEEQTIAHCYEYGIVKSREDLELCIEKVWEPDRSFYGR